MRLLPLEEQERYKYRRGIFTYTGQHASTLIAIVFIMGQFFSMLDAWKPEENE